MLPLVHIDTQRAANRSHEDNPLKGFRPLHFLHILLTNNAKKKKKNPLIDLHWKPKNDKVKTLEIKKTHPVSQDVAYVLRRSVRFSRVSEATQQI